MLGIRRRREERKERAKYKQFINALTRDGSVSLGEGAFLGVGSRIDAPVKIGAFTGIKLNLELA